MKFTIDDAIYLMELIANGERFGILSCEASAVLNVLRDQKNNSAKNFEDVNFVDFEL